MAVEKTKVKSYRLKLSTIEAINELCLKADRKHNWFVQKILDAYINSLKLKNEVNNYFNSKGLFRKP